MIMLLLLAAGCCCSSGSCSSGGRGGGGDNAEAFLPLLAQGKKEEYWPIDFSKQVISLLQKEKHIKDINAPKTL